MKKRVFTGICLAAVLVLSLFMAACTDDGAPDVRFTVTAEYDATQGLVTFADAEGKTATSFTAGTQVAVTVTPNEGYEVEAFTVNGNAAQLSGGGYAFTIVANTSVKVTFKETEKENTFTVSAEYDATQGAVTVTDAESKTATSFKEGAQATVTVTPNEGYEVDTFTVNDVAARLTDGTYSFAVSANTTVKVTFKESTEPDDKTPQELLSEALESVKTTFTATGSYIYSVEGKTPAEFNVVTVFGDKAVSIFEFDSLGTIYDDVYVDVDGKLAVPYHTLNNTIEYQYPVNDELFAEYDNPFKLLAVADFTETSEKNVFALAAEKAESAATAITGYTEKIASFTVTIADGKVTEIDIVTERIKRGQDESAYYYTSAYTFILSEWEEAEVDAEKTAPYETTAEHAALAEALSAARDAKTYTVTVHEEEVGYEDIDYDTYVTESAIYYDCLDWESGYVQMGEGAAKTVYPFDYEPETQLVTLYDAVKGFPTVLSMRASFDGFAPEVFECVGDGTYILREACYTTQNVRDVLINFADGLDVIRLYAGYTYDVSITLKDGALYRVDLYYIVGDAQVTRTLTYSAFDDTTMPITFDNCEKVSVLDEFVGTYTDGEVTVVIDKNSIEINDEEYEITDYDMQYKIFTGDWNDGEWYIAKQGEKQLILFNIDADITYVLTSTAIDPVAIPEEFEGVWSKESHTVAIAYNKVEWDGAMLTVLSYDEEDGLYAAGEGVTYRLFAEELQDGTPIVLAIAYVDGLSTAYYDMTAVTNAVLVPEVLLGAYEKFDNYYNKNYKAVIGLTSVALEMGSDKPTVTVVAATYQSNSYWELTLDVDGVEYFIMEGSYSTDQIDLGSMEDRFSITLDRVGGEEPPVPPAVAIPDTFYGTYTGEDEGVQYVVTLSADGLTIKIDDADAIEITDYEYDDGDIAFFIDELQYGLYNYDYDTEVQSIMLYSYGGLYVELTRENSDSGDIKIPEKYYGEYEGEDGGTHITINVVISAEGITVTFNDDEPIQAVIQSAGQVDDGYGGAMFGITMLLNGKQYSMSEGYKDGELSIYSDFDAGNTVQTSVKCVEEGGDEPPAPSTDIPDDFVGTFEGTDSVLQKSVKVIIAKDSVQVCIDGEEKVATIEKVENGYYGDELYVLIDEEEYLFGTYRNGYSFSSVADDGESLFAELTKATGGDEPDPSESDWAKYYGTFTGTKNDVSYSVIIDKDGVAVTIDGVAQEVTIEEFDDFEGFTLTIDEATYYVVQHGYDEKISAIDFCNSDYSLYVTLTKATGGDEPDPSDVEIPEKFYGDFMVNSDGTFYYIAIDQDGICVAIDGEETYAVIVDYDEWEGFTVTLDGETYYITQANYEDEVTKIALMSSDYRTVNVVLDKM